MSIHILALALPAAGDTCDAYGPPEPVGNVAGSSVNEASGLAVAKLREGVLFTHGDKGGDAVLVSFRADGTLLDEHVVTDADNVDWEDLASAPCPDEGWCLYIGDIGDNDADRVAITVYVVREPEPGDERIHTIARYDATYPDGPVDAETLLVHPCTGRMSVVTKASDGLSRVYRFPPLAGIDGPVALEEVGQLALSGPTAESRKATGGAFDDDGDRVAVRTADRTFLWTVDPDDPDAHWSTAPVELVGAAERRSEGIAFAADGGLYTVGEGDPIPLSYAACSALVPPPGDATCEFPQTGRKCGCATGEPAGAAVVWLATGWGLLARRRRAAGPRATTGR